MSADINTDINHNTVKEVWKDIPNYKDCYQVSNLGRVKSLKRHNVLRDRFLKPQITAWGYHIVALCKNGKATKFSVHALVARAFMGSAPSDYEINHIDGDKSNNQTSNLEYVTRTENMRHAWETGLNKSRGEKNGCAKLTKEQVLEIRAIYAQGGVTYKELAKRYGVTCSPIAGIIRREYWKHI